MQAHGSNVLSHNAYGLWRVRVHMYSQPEEHLYICMYTCRGTNTEHTIVCVCVKSRAEQGAGEGKPDLVDGVVVLCIL